MADSGSIPQRPEQLLLGPPRRGERLQRWLYDGVRTAIVEGRMRPGARLPSTRQLSLEWRVARGTVVAAYDQLAAEGYVTRRQGSGAFVSDSIPDELNRLAPAPLARKSRQKRVVHRTPDLPRTTTSPFPLHGSSAARAFRPFQPDCKHFPVAVWARLLSRVTRKSADRLLRYGDAAGFLPLREEIAAYLGSARGVRASPGQIVITSGTQQSLDLIVRLLLQPGDEVVVEDPLYAGVRVLLESAGAKLIPIPVDADGLQVEALLRLRNRHPRLVYVTPANHCPLGWPLSLSRRFALINWARSAGALIFEDDYNGEYRYAGRPLPALQGLDDFGSVIYGGTFNKVLFSSIRLGYLVLPDSLVERVLHLRSLSDRFPATILEAALTEFIREGHFVRHIRRMREIYASRLDTLQRAAAAHLDCVSIDPVMNGLETVGWLPDDADDASIAQAMMDAGIETRPISKFSIQHTLRPGLILGFGAITPEAIKAGVREMAKVFRTMPEVRGRAS